MFYFTCDRSLTSIADSGAFCYEELAVFRPGNGSPMATNVVLVVVLLILGVVVIRFVIC